ncbi:hypothetical protein SAMN05878482_101423 [Peribacillus simplex]|uniref:Uncharacterized protein n=1 Tax=Peribacillus simplex TaxID=1478 RepID=A0A9X8WHA2_9BACI|nr:hypothetical protein SAMN05878482_101423 [Peribacillus simplex]
MVTFMDAFLGDYMETGCRANPTACFSSRKRVILLPLLQLYPCLALYH